MAVKRGDKLSLSAAKWNRLDDVIARHNRGNDTPPQPGFSDARDGIILVRNQTGIALSPTSVVGISDPVITPAQDASQFSSFLLFNAVVPTDGTTEGDEDYTGKFAILLEPLGANYTDTAAAVLVGITPAKLSVTSESDKYADINPGLTTSLKTGTTGSAQIIWKESGTGDKIGLVRIGNTVNAGEIRCARFTTEVSDDLTYGTVKIWEFDDEATENYPEGDFVETEEEVHPVFCFLRPAGETIAERTRCHITEAGGVTVAIVVACEPDPEETPP